MTERIRLVARGDGLSATRENASTNLLHEIADAVTPEFGDASETEAHSQLMYITDVTGTALLAVAGTLAPSGTPTIFTVRLAPELVEGSRDGVTITIIDVNNATADDGLLIETWRMTKPFAIGDVIEAFQWDADGVFVDRNIAGRMWAADPLVSGGGS